MRDIFRKLFPITTDNMTMINIVVIIVVSGCTVGSEKIFQKI